MSAALYVTALQKQKQEQRPVLQIAVQREIIEENILKIVSKIDKPIAIQELYEASKTHCNSRLQLKNTGILATKVLHIRGNNRNNKNRGLDGTLKNTTTTATDISGSFNRVVSKKE